MPDIVNLGNDINASPKLAILIKSNAARNIFEIEANYADAINLPRKEIVLVKLPYYKNFKVSEGKAELSKTIPALARMGVKFLYIADGNYAKILLNAKKVADLLGDLQKVSYLGHSFNMMYGVNYRQSFYNDTALERLQFTLARLNNDIMTNGLKIRHDPLTDFKHHWELPNVIATLEQLKKVNCLTADIESFGLDFTNCGIATIAFGANKHTARTIRVDADYDDDPDSPFKLTYRRNEPVRAALRDFFETYEGKLIWHNANFDIKVLIYYLWMDEDPLNQEGLIRGLEVMTRIVEDTKLIAYLALNSTARNDLSLKTLAMEHMGQYAVDVTDIRTVEMPDLERYNANDAIATRFVYDKYYPRMVKDDQLWIYENIFIPSVKVLLQIELSGMPMSKERVKNASRLLSRKLHRYEKFLALHPLIDEAEEALRALSAEKANKKLKKLRKTAEDFNTLAFNPNSNNQIALLVYEIMAYPVTVRTDSKAPSASTKALSGILKKAKPEHQTVLRALIGIKEISIILNTFISAFIDKSVEKEDGRIYLHGNFNLGGTVSGRLSSSGPNMQNIPSTGSVYAKLIKGCFMAPPGWIMVGADFSSLEDRISALTTKDPAKLQVYTDGFDGHSLRAFNYFRDSMPDIIDGDINSINSIAQKYPKQRQDSKGPTFCLTYGGTHYALVETCGLDFETAIQIEQSYHEMYEVSDKWVAEKIEAASSDGYVTVAFGLRVRTPYIKRCVLGSSQTPPEAQAEARTAGNALGQSYGLLNNRAGIEFQERTLNSPFVLDIRPIAHIHDSQYFIVRNRTEVLEWLNRNLIECMEWQQLPEIQHPTVSLGGEVEVYYPSWAEKVVLPNNAKKDEILRICREHGKKYL